MSVDCMKLFMLGVDRWRQAFLCSLTLSTLQNVSPSFGVLLFLKSEGDFPCPRVHTSRNIGTNEDVSLLAGRRPLLSR
jgi:hypothetical protein